MRPNGRPALLRYPDGLEGGIFTRAEKGDAISFVSFGRAVEYEVLDEVQNSSGEIVLVLGEPAYCSADD